MSKRKPIGAMRAFLIDTHNRKDGVIYVPVHFDGIPVVPGIVKLDKDRAVKIKDYPLTYQSVGKPEKASREFPKGVL